MLGVDIRASYQPLETSREYFCDDIMGVKISELVSRVHNSVLYPNSFEVIKWTGRVYRGRFVCRCSILYHLGFGEIRNNLVSRNLA